MLKSFKNVFDNHQQIKTGMGSHLLDTTWNSLSSAIIQVFELKNMTKLDFIKLRDGVRRYFLSEEYENLIITRAFHPNEASNEHENSNLSGGDMYFRLKHFLGTLMEGIATQLLSLSNENFANDYLKKWETYKFAIDVISSIFEPMDNTWVRRNKQENTADMLIKLWKEKLFETCSNSLVALALEIVEQARSGVLDRNDIYKKIVESILYLDRLFSQHQQRSATEQSKVIYQSYFEGKFLNNTQVFYQGEVLKLSSEASVAKSLRKIKGYFNFEHDLCKNFAHESTIPKLITILDEVLVQPQLDAIILEGQNLIEQENTSDLVILFSLIKDKEHVVNTLVEAFEQRLSKVAFERMETVYEQAHQDAKVYVTTITSIYKPYLNFANEAFGLGHRFHSVIDKVFSDFVNNNAVVKKTKRPKISAELLAQYSDILLRKGEKETESQDLESTLNDIMVIFKYIQDKDAFEKFYGRYLAKRLISRSSASDEHEESMILKLKEICGFEFSSKLQRMFQDIGLSSALVDEYKNIHPRKANEMEFSPQVLTSNLWSFNPQGDIHLPTELEEPIGLFTKFYCGKYNGRKLIWLHHLSTCELTTFYTTRKYTLLTSTYQTVILLQFNRSDQLTVGNIIARTNITSEKCIATLLILLKKGILDCPELASKNMNAIEESSIQDTYALKLRQNFQSKNVRININTTSKTVKTNESESIDKNIDEERKYMLQAIIVRTMKARRQMTHTELIDEILPTIAKRFRPEVPKIKKVIEGLIDSEYLRRGETNDVYQYVT